MAVLPRFAHITPAAVRLCRDADDVARAIAEARQRGLDIAVRSGGHCFAGRSSTTGLLIDVGPMNAIAVDGETATIGAGAKLGQVYDALAAHGRTIAAGCGPEVGIAGLARMLQYSNGRRKIPVIVEDDKVTIGFNGS